ncbi:MAG: hypothetical protein AAGK78_12400, partial [Planctomycetota bacterium]
LFALAARAPNGDREWRDYFTEAAADFYLREEQPHGYLTEEEVQTLKSRTETISTESAFALYFLVKLLEDATQSPASMTDYVGDRIKSYILKRPEGPRIDEDDAALIRRFIFAAGGDGNIAVTRDEAEWLFDLNDAVSGADNHPAWAELFKKAVANCLMAHIGYQPLGRMEAISLDRRFHDDETRGGLSAAGGFWSRIKTALSNPAKRVEARYGALNEERADAAIEAEKITATEADWLYARIARDGGFDASERALMQHLKSLDADLPPKLRALVEKAA